MDTQDLPIAVLTVDKNNNIRYANNACHDLFGYKTNELINRPLDILIPFKFKEEHFRGVKEYWERVYPKPLGFGRDLVGLKKDGSIINVEIGLYPYHDVVLVLVVDVTIRLIRNARKELEHISKRLDEIRESGFNP